MCSNLLLISDKLYEAYESQCCGGEVVSRGKVCCGGDHKGAVYEADDNKVCCAEEYVKTSTSVCCKDKDKAKVDSV